jgi:predicted Fe-Mo cluster-binding NifX family protein
MRVVIPVHRGRISPLFDTARRATVVDFQGDAPPSRTVLELPGGPPRAQLEAVLATAPDAVVCGAISRSMLRDLLGRGLRVWPQVVANADAVVEALGTHGSLGTEFRMPGCGARPRARGGGGPRVRSNRIGSWGWQTEEST